MTWENRLTFEVSSADPDAAVPVWVNLTSRVRDAIQPVTMQVGRQNDLNQSEPTRLDLLLDNADDALTYGNTASPYTWWGPGRKCRLRETIAGTTNTLFTGYLQVPNEGLVTAGIEQRVSITAVDRLGRLQSGRPFVSTLGAHIAGSGNGALVAYYPLLDRSRPFLPVVGNGSAEVVIATGSVNPAEVQPMVSPAGGTALPGDDLPAVLLTVGTNAGANSWSPYLSLPQVLQLAAGQVVTVVVWIRPDLSTDLQAKPINFGTTGGQVELGRRAAAAGNAWRLTSPLGSLTGDVTSTVQAGSDRWTMLGVRFGYSPNVLDLWVDDQIYPGTLAGTFVGSQVISGINSGSQTRGSIAHLQVYVGAASDWTNTDFSAQRAVGLYGLERQATGDRVRSIAQYAGIPAAEVTQVDKGTSVMQRATLAGKDPLTAMRDAERTEQGLLYVDGGGNLLFKDRNTLFNI